MQILYRLVFFFSICMGIQAVSALTPAEPVHALAMHGSPKYPLAFEAFEYVNPTAPKRGTLNQGAIGMFDTFNPYVINGIAPAGIGLTYDTLMKQSLDEPFTLYGLIAQTAEMPADRSYVAFNLNPAARFSDGSPITADDVIFSFEALRQYGLPTYRYYYADVDKVYKTSETRVVFEFKADAQNAELPLILGELPVLSKAYWAERDFTKTTLSVPVSSGPYLIGRFEPGKYIEYKLNPDYWAADLNVNKGWYNFTKIKFDYYRDATVLAEAFKAGVLDVRQENEAKKWAALSSEPAVQSGQMIRKEFAHHMPSGMQGFVFNLRRPIFSDVRVREALGYAFDFNWANQNLFHGLYRRTTSYFDNSFLKAPPLPDAAERAVLERYRLDIPAQVFDTPYTLPDAPAGQMRANLKKALMLLEQAGWHVKDNVLQNEAGVPFEFEILLDAASAPTWERIVLPFVGQLKRLGITAQIAVADVIQYKNRLDSFDYDMIVSVWGQSLSPGNEQRYFWGSAAADTVGSSNYVGLKNPAVDGLIEEVVSSTSESDLITAVHALDRVLLWSYLVIPHWHTPVLRFVYWDKFGIPDKSPDKGMSLLTWWLKTPQTGL
ncbi:MAG: extracellular solute-binding protein [Alphaproteobacteria bacterium]